MDKLKKPNMFIWFSVLPNLFAVALTATYLFFGSISSSKNIFICLGCLVILGACVLCYAFFRKTVAETPRSHRISLWIITAAVYAALLYFLYTTPQFTMLISIELIVMLCASISLCGLSLMSLAHKKHFTEKDFKRSAFFILGIPLLCALMSIGIESPTMTNNGLMMLSICLIVVCVLCLSICFGMKRHADDSLAEPKKIKPYRQTAIVNIFALIFPVIGLSLAAFLQGGLHNIANIWFFLIAIANGSLILYTHRTTAYRLLPWYLLCVGYSFILYFTVMFIPLIPIGLISSLAFVGLLLLTPEAVCYIQTRTMIDRYRELRERHSAAVLISLLVLGVCTLPAIGTGDILLDRMHYHRAISNASTSDFAKRSYVNPRRLTRALTQLGDIDSNVRRMRSMDAMEIIFNRSGDMIPLFSNLYNFTVLRNAPISVATQRKLYDTYYAPNAPYVNKTARQPSLFHKFDVPAVQVIDHKVTTRYDETIDAYRSFIDLKIVNRQNRNLVEFAATFEFPEDCYISDYTLFVGAINKRGILSEKSSAEELYERIVHTPRDPGLLTYVDGRTVSLRVYPFDAGQTRKTGFEITHRGDVSFDIGDYGISIGYDNASEHGLKGHGARCTEKTCTHVLDYGDDEFINALTLIHNARIQPDNVDLIYEAFDRRVLTRTTAFIVLENADQEMQLQMMQTQALWEKSVSMSEPSLIPMIIAMAAVVIVINRRRRRA